jgi:hypothetical protein
MDQIYYNALTTTMRWLLLNPLHNNDAKTPMHIKQIPINKTKNDEKFDGKNEG